MSETTVVVQVRLTEPQMGIIDAYIEAYERYTGKHLSAAEALVTMLMSHIQVRSIWMTDEASDRGVEVRWVP